MNIASRLLPTDLFLTEGEKMGERHAGVREFEPFVVPVKSFKRSIESFYRLLCEQGTSEVAGENYKTVFFNDYAYICEALDRLWRERYVMRDHATIDGVPKIVRLAVFAVENSKGKIDAPTFSELLKQYQRFSPLRISELCTIETACRCSLFGYLSDLCDLANEIAEKERVARRDAKRKEFALKNITSCEYISTVMRFAEPKYKNEVEQLLSDNGMNAEDFVNLYEYKKTDLCASFSSVIASLREIEQCFDCSTIISLSVADKFMTECRDELYNASDDVTKMYYLGLISEKAGKTNETVFLAEQKVLYGDQMLRNLVEKSNFSCKIAYYLISFLNLTAWMLVIAFLDVRLAWLTLPYLFASDGIIRKIVGSFAVEKKVPKAEKYADVCADTLIVICALAESEDDAGRLNKSVLEVKYANPGFRCALLIDFPPSCNDYFSYEERKTIERFKGNAARNDYGLIIRKRKYSKSSKMFAGYERKRGALCELNEYLLGKKIDFSECRGIDKKYRFVITLDEDNFTTKASELCAVMAHPANKDVAVASLCPRVSVAGRNKNAFTKLFCFEECGNYDSERICFERDVLGVNNYTGKGIYRVSAFAEKTAGAFPDNAILSHDYIEGVIAGSLTTDMTVLEGFPDNYAKSEARRLRWLRGDVQLLPYLFGKVRDKSGNKIKNRLNFEQKMHILQNILFVFVAPSLFISLFVFCVYDFYPGIAVLLALIFSPFLSSVFEGGANAAWTLNVAIERTLYIATLPYRALIDFTAFFVTLIRLKTKKNLLKWDTFAKSSGSKAYLIVSLVFAVLFLIFAIISAKVQFYVFALLFLCVLFIPLTSVRIKSKEKIACEYLKNVAKDTWRYYDAQFEKNEYLVCDNFSEENGGRYAKRTSPTNIGFSLCACVCALNCGFIDRNKFDRITYRILEKLSTLKKWNGHLYNWYDTDSGNVLYPSYVSTVDSGNFFMSLCYAMPFFNGVCAEIAKNMIENADFLPLFDLKKKLLFIGYNGFENKIDNGHYDLAASESLVTYLFCVGYEKIPGTCFEYLKRKCSRKYRCQYSWTGGCFEYLMPWLFTDFAKGSDTYLSARSVAKLQKRYRKNGVWGTSESQFRQFDDSGNRMYKAFGIDKIALSRWASGGVIAPYASFLCLQFDVKSVVENAAGLGRIGAFGVNGFYESVDGEVIKTYMAHHQGMILMSITNYIDGSAKKKLSENARIASAVKRFERLPDYERYAARKYPVVHAESISEKREFVHLSDEFSEINMISSGNYFVTTGLNANGKALYRTDLIYDGISGGEGFSLDVAVSGGRADVCKTTYSKGETAVFLSAGEFTAEYSVRALNGYDGEMRIVEVANPTNRSLNFEIKALLGLVLAKEKDYVAHPAFNRLFITVIEKGENYVLCENRKSNAVCGISVCGANVIFSLRNATLEINAIPTLKPGERKSICICVFCADDMMSLRNKAKILCDLRLNERIKENFVKNDAFGASIDQCVFAAKTTFESFGSNTALFKNGYAYAYPVKVLQVKSIPDVYGIEKKLRSFARIYKFGYKFDIVVAISEQDGYFSSLKKQAEEGISASGIRSVLPEGCRIDTVSGKIGEEILRLSSMYYVNRTLLKNASKTFYLIDAAVEEKELNFPERLLNVGCGYYAKDYSFVIVDNQSRPFCNIISNKNGGTIISCGGGGFTFGQNSREQKITAFFDNDASSEILFLREKGTEWSINSLCGNRREYCRHALGYTEFVSVYAGIESHVKVFMTRDGEKVYLTEIRNVSGKTVRGVEICFALFPVLGAFFDENACAIDIREIESGKSVIENTENGKKIYVDFIGCDFRLKQDNEDFIRKSSKKALNIPYFSTMSDIVLDEPLTFSIIFGDKEAHNYDKNYIESEFLFAREKYANLSTVGLDFDSSLCALFKWLPYQVYCSRFYGRVGYYQVGGAYGFRDQLQDCLAMLYVNEKTVREYICYCAARQFESGYVMHWWHHPFFGVRTEIMDDRLFLPYVVAEYIAFSGDCCVLGERIPFLKDVTIPRGRDSVCGVMQQCEGDESLLEHCKRAISSVCDEIAPDGLVYMRGGDWNDGMNKIGIKGKGKSVWLSMFLYEVIGKFLKHITLPSEKKYYIEKRALLRKGVEDCFNGKYFLRAIADDGTVIGGENSDECKIDLLTQAYAAISGITTPERMRSALDYAEKMLVDKDNGIIKLLDPPFSDSKKVGYIGDYPPGIRENGGQYTHAAIWFIYALYLTGQKEKAFEYLQMINPVERYLCGKGEKYGAEPYVVSADVYSGERAGEAGWSWYTGSAAWTFVTVVRKTFGIDIKSGVAAFSPALPKSIKNAKVEIRHHGIVLSVEIRNEGMGEWRIEHDGVTYNTNAIDLKLLKSDKNIVVKRSLDT